jgi:hypothetical protein
LFTVGIYSLWLSFPIVIDYLFRVKMVNTQLTLFRDTAVDDGGAAITEPQLIDARRLVVILSIIGCLVYIYRYPFFDRHDRLRMHYGLDNRYLKGIYTTEERATALNELFHEADKYVKKDDYLLAYQCMPMLNYAYRAKPFMRNSYPWLYEAKVFKEELNKGLVEAGTLPIVIMQKVKTIGNMSNWPDSSHVYNADWEKKNEERNGYMNDFLESNSYHEVWSNEIFRIFLPPQRAVGISEFGNSTISQ